MTNEPLDELKARVSGWLVERLPGSWLAGPVEVELDREEALVVLPIGSEFDPARFRDATRAKRIELARQAEEAFGLKISWGVTKDGRRRLYTIVRSPVTTPLALPERQVLDGLVSAGVASDRSEAVAWCVRLVGQHEADWLRDLRDGVAAGPPVRHGPAVAI